MKTTDGKNNKDILEILGHIVKNMATKDDINDLRSELKTDINDLRSELKTDINDLRSELKTDIQNHDSKLEDLKTELQDFKKETFERMDAFVERVADDKQESKALELQVDRHESWIKVIAKKIGIELN